MELKYSIKTLTNVNDITNQKIIYRLLLILAVSISLQLISTIHMRVSNDEFWAPLPIMLFEIAVISFTEVYTLIAFLYIYFKKYGYKSWLPFAINLSSIGLLIFSILLLDFKIDTSTYVQYIILMLKFIVLAYSIILIYKLRFQAYKIRIKIKSAIIISIAIIELVIIILGFLYLISKYPLVFQKKYPAVLIINIEGEVVTSSGYGILEKRGQNRTNATTSSNVIRMLEFFSQDDSIKAFILEIDAFGGQTAGQEELVRYIKRMDKPVVAVIQGSALSSGYYVAAGTNKIYAHRSAKIGKIAENFVYVNRIRRGNEQVCYITSSNYKNITNNDCSGFEPEVFKRLKHYVELTHKTLISHIAEMRRLDVSFVESLSNNETMASSQTLELRLIDEIGTTDDAILWLENKLGIKLWRLYLRDMLPQMAMK